FASIAAEETSQGKNQKPQPLNRADLILLRTLRRASGASSALAALAARAYKIAMFWQAHISRIIGPAL
ncbi:hypothetical protein, partial [Thioclava indica]|uniref:hypothetical protein n=1 Tax=Thioclava indica TaxID=1353528 RepID=UPI00056ED6EE